MHVVECCWACHGSGHHLKSVAPIRFVPCWMCYGRRGRTVGREAFRAGPESPASRPEGPQDASARGDEAVAG